MSENVVGISQGMDEIQAMRYRLDEKIPASAVSQREQAGRTLDYLEGWYVIDRMNRVFGQSSWGYHVEEMRLVHAGEVEGKFVAHYVSKVTVFAVGTAFSDYGYGDGQDKRNPGKAHELAVKEAATDGIKRACKNFGMSMGLALYDKSKENVDEEIKPAARGRTARAAEAKQPASLPGPDQHTGAPTSGAGTAIQGAGAARTANGAGGTPGPLQKAKSRDDVNALLAGIVPVVISKKKFPDVAAVKAYMLEKYTTDKKELLTDEQAGELFTYLFNLSI